MKDSESLMDMSQQRYPDDISESFFIDCLASVNKVDKVLVTCVAVPKVWQTFKKAILSRWAIKVERVVSKANGYGVINGYENAAELGSDRWCALIGAYNTARTGVVVISCGSAITIDIVNQSGDHLGGYILPGLTMMKKSLALNTAQVKVDVSLSEGKISPATSTSGCVEAGVNLAAVSVIESAMKQQLAHESNLQCFLTGGDADYIAEHLIAEYVKMPDLVIRGLAVIAESNQE